MLLDTSATALAASSASPFFTTALCPTKLLASGVAIFPERMAALFLPLGSAGLPLLKASLGGGFEGRGEAGREKGSCEEQSLEGHFVCFEYSQSCLEGEGRKNWKRGHKAHVIYLEAMPACAVPAGHGRRQNQSLPNAELKSYEHAATPTTIVDISACVVG